MANPLFNNFGNQPNPMANLIKQAREFRKNFAGSPKDEVQRLLNSGKMSQQEFNRLSQIAQQIIQNVGDDI